MAYIPNIVHPVRRANSQRISPIVRAGKQKRFWWLFGSTGNRLTISANRTSGVAPAGFFFEVDGAHNNYQKFHNSFYVWDYGDPGATFTAVSDLPWDTSAETSTGPFGAHVYSSPGTYTVTCTRYYVSGGVLQRDVLTSIEVTVEDPDVFFSGETYVVALDGIFTGAPAGTQYSDFPTAWAQVTRNGGRLRLKRGETIDTPGVVFRDFGDGSHLLIDAWGSGARPVLHAATGGSGNFIWLRDGAEFVISGIKVAGDYDPTIGNIPAAGFIYGIFGSVDFQTIYDCEFKGCNIGVYALAADDGIDRPFVIADCTMTDWLNYGVFGDLVQSAVIGCHIKQNASAVSGADGKQTTTEPVWADHGPIRSGFVSRSLFSMNSMRSTTGWSSNGDAHQPCIRYNSNGAASHSGVFERNRFEGGWSVLNFSPQNSVTPPGDGQLLVDKNYIRGSANSDHIVDLVYGNATFRNNLLHQPNLNDGLLNAFEHAFSVDPTLAETGSAANVAGPVRSYNNTFVQERTGSPDFGVISAQWSGMDYVEVNNIVHAPGASNSASFTDYTPLDVNDFYRPQPGSAALNNASGTFIAIDDFTGKFRGELGRTIGLNTARGATGKAYTQNLIDTAGSIQLSLNTGPADHAKGTYSAWVNFDSLTGFQHILVSAGRTYVANSGGGTIQVVVRDTLNNVIYGATTSNPVLTAGQLHHVHFKVDISDTLAPSAVLTVDGVVPAMTVTTPLVAGTGLLNHARRFDAISTAFAGQVSDIFFSATEALDASLFIDASGNPVNIVAVGSPAVFLGSDMTADERNGNTSQGWNDAFNLGSSGTLALTGGTLTNAA